MLTLDDVLWGIGLPAVLAAAVLLALAYALKRRKRWADLAWPAAIAAGYVAGHLAVKGLPGEPWDVDAWLLVFAAPVGLLAAVLAISGRVGFVLGWVTRAVAAALLPLLLLYQPYLSRLGGEYAPWTTPQAMGWIAGCIFVTLGIWLVWRRATVTEPQGRSLPLAATILAAGTGLTIMMSDSQTIGQLGLALTAALAGAWVASWLAPRLAVGGAIDVAWPVTVGLLIVGRFFAEQQPTNLKWALLAGAPLLMLLADLPAVHRRKPIVAATVRVLAVAIPVAVALTLAFVKFQREMTESGYM